MTNTQKPKKPRTAAQIANPGGRPKKPAPASTTIRTENRLEALEDLRERLARAIELATESSNAIRVLPGLSRQFRETLAEIEEIKAEKAPQAPKNPLDELMQRRAAREAARGA